MFVLKNTKTEIEKQMKNAIAKCFSLEKKPHVKMRRAGEYEVIGNENRYTVKMRIGEQGAKIIDCNCKAGENGMICYHAAAALPIHSAIKSRM
jgi:hypothetical protein